MTLTLEGIYAHPYWTKRTWISEVSPMHVFRTHEALLAFEELGLEEPSVFMGLADEGEATRCEWLEDNAHTVLGICLDGSYEIYHIDFRGNEITSCDFIADSLGEAILILSQYLINFEPHSAFKK